MSWFTVDPTAEACGFKRQLIVVGGSAHQRLSILDHEGGHQPMVTPDENIGVVFNGQVYNHFLTRQN